ncbi:MAG: hypothetical protein COB10_13025 [Planctomycetota bacterium]|nr:MAG: hypothetical protein COB10_13025 [Planctomycetota bacterium]
MKSSEILVYTSKTGGKETWKDIHIRQKEIIAALEMKVTDLLMELDRERDQLEWLEQREARDAG